VAIPNKVAGSKTTGISYKPSLIPSELTTTSSRYVITGLCVLLFLFSLLEPHRNALNLLEHTEEEAAESLVAVALLKVVVGIAAGSHLPGVSGAADGVEGFLNDIFDYVALTNSLLVAQMLLLQLSKSWLFKILTLIPLVLFAFNKVPEIALKILIILLLISPGLDIALNGINYLHHELGRPATAETHRHAKEAKEIAENHREPIQDQSSETRKTSRIDYTNHPLLKHVQKHIKPERSHRVHHGLKEKVSQWLGAALKGMIAAILLFLLLPLGYATMVYFSVKKMLGPNVSRQFQSTLLFSLVGGAMVITVLSFTVPSPASVVPSKEVDKLPIAVQSTAGSHLISEAHHDSLLGIDVSHFNGEINWADVRKKGIHFAYAKATQGNDFSDPEFKKNWAGMKAEGIARGSYHFYVANIDPEEQAKFFISEVDSITMKDMPPMLDLEGSGIGGLSKRKYMSNVLKWLDEVEKAFGRRPIIYTDNPFANEHLTDPQFAKYHLWIAEYGPVAHIPKTWKENGWIIWQHTASEKMAGVNGVTDGDMLVGDATVLFEAMREPQASVK